ncbi:bifunctional (p)ppGpp synthetase/guanosine-3',5'-bis(diphosphate) 3'-pyrophosphohydrolase [Jiella sp. MQZ9-1]|uniref:GTP pyrophosphokinase rsh n=1 Tax=Jiella flava TaxID=2816857 RepID=A0A939JSQ7_9HYPH|nr:bifunctional (p)ppGpp synthetase/guanosine-3',5'-bis(diphosphate) 3'-pyrophosphohydrolase [Jiella flava]MBO0663213.1 bifunctional (p)ppGpp synthetase/guanosine-3',5'-bis(diphosphate) 3'-pyrophosphohydrolase [Jiella flava]MCD2471788.1 bifunctional (p)ppGpp synthetase/guanosine-3',5'-bis(diphosphate) 3'-pyrophosphohydrolase [Jiella flava]
MMRQYELVEKVAAYKPNLDEALLNRAYVYAMQKHGTQKRASGDPYFSHPLEVAAILTELHLDEATIAVALLHDTIEDTDATRKEIDQLFGPKIGQLVEGLTKLKKLDLVSKRAAQAENLRKLLLAIADDIRVLLVKLADRLHNMRTLGPMAPEKRARIAQETMDIYAPLAGRMGMQDLRDELESLAFRHINLDAFETITARLAELRQRHAETIAAIERDLTAKLKENGIHATVYGRQKTAHSVFSKMQRKALSLEQLSDIFGFRVIVDDEEACYQTLGIVHRSWPMVPGRFKDYISIPKQNDYRSLHTTIVGPSRQRVELQIRTQEMHEIAEYGVAAHTLYKDGALGGPVPLSKDSNAYGWLRRTIELLAAGDSAEEFLEHTKLELFQDQVFCFTPKGRLIALPRGATPIDFAYAVHSEVGDNCVGCKIDGRIMPVVTELANGDEVEIITAKGQTPPQAWENIAVTGKARAAIRRASRTSIRKQYSGVGQQILDRTFTRAGKTFSRDALKPLVGKLGHREVDDALAAVGRGELKPADVLRAAFPDYQESRAARAPEKGEDEGWFNLRTAAGMIFRMPGRTKAKPRKNGNPIPIRGAGDDMPVHFGPDGAVPGDRIVGIIEPGKGIIIYPIQSPALTAYDDEPDRWIDVRWDIDEAMSERFPARIMLSARNEPGSLAEIAETIAINDANIHTLSMVSTAHDFTKMVIELEVWDLQHLTETLRQLRAKPCVSEVWRVNG